MNDLKKQNAKSSTMSQVTTSDDIKSDLSKVKSNHSDAESDSSDNNEEKMYKNLTEEQLLRARKYNECFICEKRFAKFSSFRTHVLRHTSQQKYKCEKCFKEFAQLQYLKAHLTTHNENRVFTCDICSLNFASRSSIRGHMRVHTGEKPYKCDVCDRSFSESSTRRKHRLTHFPHIKKPVIRTSRKKEYSCPICSKRFHYQSSVSKHKKKSCLNLKPLSQCEFCVQLFKEKVAQIRDNEDGSCKLCGKMFPTTRGLGIHLRTHIADKKFQCVLCMNKYTPDVHLKKSFYA